NSPATMRLSTPRRASLVTSEATPLRLFLDAGVIIEGCPRPWSASRGVLVLTRQREGFTVVLGEAIERELRVAVARRAASLAPTEADGFVDDVASWLARVRLERWPAPSLPEIQGHRPTLLPVLRHINDLAAVVTAVQARPDWVIS